MQKMINVVASVMEFTMATTPAESFNAAGNIFIGLVSVMYSSSVEYCGNTSATWWSTQPNVLPTGYLVNKSGIKVSVM